MTKTDPTADTVTIDKRGLVRIDQIVLFKMIRRRGKRWVIIQDRNKQRSCMRGTNQVEVAFDALVEKLTK